MGGILSERIQKTNAAVAEPTISRAATTTLKEEYVKPATTKKFSDGAVRKWDDHKQGWVVIESERYKR